MGACLCLRECVCVCVLGDMGVVAMWGDGGALQVLVAVTDGCLVCACVSRPFAQTTSRLSWTRSLVRSAPTARFSSRLAAAVSGRTLMCVCVCVCVCVRVRVCTDITCLSVPVFNPVRPRSTYEIGPIWLLTAPAALR